MQKVPNHAKLKVLTNISTYFAGDDPFSDTESGHALTRAIVDTLHEPFLVLDADLRIIVASRSFYEKFKVKKKKLRGDFYMKWVTGNTTYLHCGIF